MTVTVGQDTSTDTPILLSDHDRLGGTYVIGKPGVGKSELLRQMIEADLKNGHGMCVLDPHGDLIRDVLPAAVTLRKPEDVYWIRLDDVEWPFGLNLYQHPNPGDESASDIVVSQLMTLYQKLWGTGSYPAWGARMAQYLRNTAYTLMDNPGTTMTEIPPLLTDEVVRRSLVKQVKNSQVRQSWRQFEIYDKRMRAERIESTLNKIEEFLVNTLARNIVGQPKTTIDFRWLMDNQKVLLVEMPARYGEVSSLIGSVIVSKLLTSALERAKTDHRPFFAFYADEYQRFATEDFSTLIAEARKFSIATTIAHQYRAQLDAQNRAAALTAATLIIFQVNGEDALELADNVNATPPPRVVSGTRPILEITNDPWSVLLRANHQNPIVHAFVVNELQPLERAIEVVGISGNQGFDPPVDEQEVHYFDSSLDDKVASIMEYEVGYKKMYMSGENLAHGRHLINQFLASVMRGELSDVALIQKLQSDIVITLRAYLQIERELKSLENRIWRDDRLRTRSDLVSLILKLMGPPSPEHRDQALFDEYVKTRTEFWFNVLKNQKYSRVKDEGMAEDLAQSRAIGEIRGIDRMGQLWAVAEELRKDPLYVDSGKVELVYELPRSVADVRNEIANTFLTMPLYRAHIKLRGSESTMWSAYSPPIEINERIQRGIDEVIEHTRREFCRPRADVEQEINERLESFSPPASQGRSLKAPNDDLFEERLPQRG